MIFRCETKKVINHVSAITIFPANITPPNSRRRSRSTDGGSYRSHSSTEFIDPSDLTAEEASGLTLQTQCPWAKAVPIHLRPKPEDDAVNQFMDKYVLYPCCETSSPGFLKHFPCLFKEVSVEGCFALR
ncbi:hypothetical protein F4811DRAFT_521293 [Daldinia bambusicola]|nr:hypothetical protein F4811DRAFT_521293 [Daldinia bambusicola]